VPGPSLSIFFVLLASLALALVGIDEILAFIAGGVVGVFIHVLMLSLFIEAMIRRIGRAWLLVPFGLYGSYYAICCYQIILIDRKSEELHASNPEQIMDFDPTRYSLVTNEAERLVSNYRIPVAYTIDGAQYPENKGFSSYRLIRKDRCKVAINKLHAVALWLHPDNVMSQNACLLRMSEAIQKKALTVVSRGDADWDHRWGFNNRVTEIALDGTVIGSFRTASLWRWSSFPFGVFFCYRSYPSFKCQGEVFGQIVYINGISTEVDYNKTVVPESVMLALPKYTQADAENFQGSDQGFEFRAN